VLFLVNVVLLEYPSYGPSKVIEFDVDIWTRTMSVSTYYISML